MSAPWPSQCSRRACYHECVRKGLVAAAERGNTAAAMLVACPAPSDCAGDRRPVAPVRKAALGVLVGAASMAFR